MTNSFMDLIETTGCITCLGTGVMPVPNAEATIACTAGCFIGARPGQSFAARPGQRFAGVAHDQVYLSFRSWCGWVDRGIAPTISALWQADWPTWVSCEGGHPTDSDGSKAYVSFIERPNRRFERGPIEAILGRFGWKIIRVINRSDMGDMIVDLENLDGEA